MESLNDPSSLSDKKPSADPHSEPKHDLTGSSEAPKFPESRATPESEGTPLVDDSIIPSSDVDGDSAVSGLSSMGSTASLRSSIYQHVEEYGRTYHGFEEGKYLLPNDAQEQDRLEIQHALFGITLGGKLYLAPVERNPENVLDIGTGTGSWAIEFEQHPDSTVIGTDLSAIQPKFVPPNCRFEIDDAEDDWVFNTKFNFIHGRALLSCFRNPRSVLQKAFDALSPGGHLEMQDAIFPMRYIGPAPVDSDLYKWNELVAEGARRSGRPWDNAQFYAQWMREVGYLDVVERNFYWPTSAWAKGEHLRQVAMFFQEDMLNGLEGISMRALTKFMGWTEEEVKALLVGVRRDAKDRNIHAYLPIKVVYGRKPLEDVGP